MRIVTRAVTVTTQCSGSMPAGTGIMMHDRDKSSLSQLAAAETAAAPWSRLAGQDERGNSGPYCPPSAQCHSGAAERPGPPPGRRRMGQLEGHRTRKTWVSQQGPARKARRVLSATAEGGLAGCEWEGVEAGISRSFMTQAGRSGEADQ
jgi:hypothetical protein